jgi:hypothetical protein
MLLNNSLILFNIKDHFFETENPIVAKIIAYLFILFWPFTVDLIRRKGDKEIDIAKNIVIGFISFEILFLIDLISREKYATSFAFTVIAFAIILQKK